MKIMQWTAFIFIMGILIIRGVLPDSFNLDSFAMGLLFLLAILLIVPYLKKAKWFGAEFIFKEEIKKLDEIVQKSEELVKEANEKRKKHIGIFETFSTKNALNLIESDPNLSLAALRIEIEKVLSRSSSTLKDLPYDIKVENRVYISLLYDEAIISHEQGEALLTIVNLCNKAIHGAQVTDGEAREIILITERLNNSFSTGYSINLDANNDYAKHGLHCEYEHCIENSPIGEEETEVSCPVFGHDCPGGKELVNSCSKTIEI